MKREGGGLEFRQTVKKFHLAQNFIATLKSPIKARFAEHGIIIFGEVE